MLYLRFVICLGVGLFGVALVLSTLMDALLSEWDMVSDVQGILAKLSRKNRVVGVESMYAGPKHLSSRMIQDREPDPEGKAFAGMNASAGGSAQGRLAG